MGIGSTLGEVQIHVAEVLEDCTAHTKLQRPVSTAMLFLKVQHLWCAKVVLTNKMQIILKVKHLTLEVPCTYLHYKVCS